MSEPFELPSVAGRMEMTHEAFQRACQVQLLRLQDISLAETGLVHVLCEAVRCSRECCEIAGGSETKARMDEARWLLENYHDWGNPDWLCRRDAWVRQKHK